MTAALSPPPTTTIRRTEGLIVALIVALAAVIRLRTLGDIVAHGDEQFYLLVGDRMLSGAVPYLDIWDRKPVGLFVLFAGIRLLGGDGIVAYQLVATLFAGATAALLGVWVNRGAGWLAGVVAGLLYLALLQTHLGFGGQAEVFVNLFVVVAGAIVHHLLRAPGRVVALGVAAMLAMGVALQIKPTAVFPGLWLGLVLLWIAFRARMPLSRLGGAALLWVMAALLPTLAALAWYAAHGALDAYLFANIFSIAAKGSDGPDADRARSIATIVRLGVPFGIAAMLLGVAAWRRALAGTAASLVFLLGWFAGGVVAFFAVPAAYPHYALIAAPMGCLLVGYAAGLHRPAGWVMVAAALGFAGWQLAKDEARIARNRVVAPQLAGMAAAIRAELRGGCLYVYHGPHILYVLTGSCLPTRFAFPNHLSTAPEATGLGIDATAEVARVLGTRPPVIVDGINDFHPPNRATQTLVRRTLAADYEKFAEIPLAGREPLAAAYRLRRGRNNL